MPRVHGLAAQAAVGTKLRQSDKVVFWNNQTHEKAFGDNLMLTGRLYLQWAGDAQEIIEVFEKHGFFVVWSGEINKCISIMSPHSKEAKLLHAI